MAKKLTPKKARQILHDKSVHGHPLTDKQRRFFGAIAGGAPMKAQTGLEYSDDLDYFGTYDAINKKGDYTKERQSVINQLSNLPIYSPEQRYMDYQTVLPYWKSNVQNVPIQTGNKTPAGGSAYYSYNAPPLGATKPYEGTVQLDPRQFGGLQTPERVLEHELRHAAFDGRHFIPQFYGEALYSTSRKPQEFYEGAHENLLNERAVMALGTRKAIIDKYGLKPDAKIPRELFDAYNRETLETGLRSDTPPMQFGDVEESFRGARSASDVYDLINFNTPKKENGGWLDKYGEGGTMQEYQENYNNPTVSFPPGFVGMGNNTKGRNYSPAWGGQFAMGGSLPGAVGFTYARTHSPAPSEGPYAKKTLPSAQNGLRADSRTFPTPYSSEFVDNLQQDYNEFYAAPKYYPVDDRYDAYLYKLKNSPNSPFMTNLNVDEGPVWEYPLIGEIQHEKDFPRDWQRKIDKGKAKKEDFKFYPNYINKQRIGEANAARLASYLSTKPKSIIEANPTPIIENKNGGMTYYQHGLDWKPKTISRNGGWLEKYDVPQAQTGDALKKLTDFANRNKLVSGVTVPTQSKDEDKKQAVLNAVKQGKVKDLVAGTKATTKNLIEKSKKNVEKDEATFKRLAEQSKKENDEELAERKAARDFNERKSKTFTFPTGETKTYEQMTPREKWYIAGKSLENKGAIGDENNLFNEYLNPLTFITSMAGELGEAPYMAEKTNSNLPYLSAIGNPLLAGALGFDPLGGAMKVPGKVAQSMESGLLSNTYKLNPWALKQNPETFLYRAQPKGFNFEVNELKHLENKLASGESLTDAEKISLNYFQKDPRAKIHQELYGKWFFDDPKKLQPYVEDKLKQGEVEILRTKLPKNEADLYSVKNNIKASLVGNPYEYVLPSDIIKNAEKFSSSEISNILKQHPKPNWLRGYKEVPKPTLQKKKGGVIEDDRGQWAHPGKITEIQGNTMATHGYGNLPLYVVPDVGEPRVVEANTGTHTFPGATKFTEYPLNKKPKTGWLDKY